MAAAALIAFGGTFGFLGERLQAGHDPALAKATPAKPVPRRVLVRTIERKKVVVHVIQAQSSSGSAARVTSAPPAQSAAPVQAAPAPAPAPAAPPPPVVTRTS
jgi:hypothetical protein